MDAIAPAPDHDPHSDGRAWRAPPRALLIAMINETTIETNRIVLKPELVVRDSVARIRSVVRSDADLAPS